MMQEKSWMTKSNRHINLWYGARAIPKSNKKWQSGKIWGGAKQFEEALFQKRMSSRALARYYTLNSKHSNKCCKRTKQVSMATKREYALIICNISDAHNQFTCVKLSGMPNAPDSVLKVMMKCELVQSARGIYVRRGRNASWCLEIYSQPPLLQTVLRTWWASFTPWEAAWLMSRWASLKEDSKSFDKVIANAAKFTCWFHEKQSSVQLLTLAPGDPSECPGYGQQPSCKRHEGGLGQQLFWRYMRMNNAYDEYKQIALCWNKKILTGKCHEHIYKQSDQDSSMEKCCTCMHQSFISLWGTQEEIHTQVMQWTLNRISIKYRTKHDIKWKATIHNSLEPFHSCVLVFVNSFSWKIIIVKWEKELSSLPRDYCESEVYMP